MKARITLFRTATLSSSGTANKTPMIYELSVEQYKGPLDKLLELIEGKKMEVTRFSLVAVTGEFLTYIEELKKKEKEDERGATSQLLADFLVIASRLLLIKSKALLPALPLSEEEEGEIFDLETRLKIYQEIKNSQLLIRNNWSVLPNMWSREFLMTREAVFYPPAGIKADDLKSSIMKLVGELEKIFKPVATLRKEIINLKAKIEEIISRLTEVPLKFNDISGGRGRNELVALFLAVLHLIKEQLVDVEQESRFGEILIAKKPPVQ